MIFLFASHVVCQVDSAVTIHGFVDVYYASSLSKNSSGDRLYTTQPLRLDEANVNLAMLDISRHSDDVRGRFAFQTGTYVESNLAAEPPLLRNILEASVGSRLWKNLWIDVGVFPCHIGLEGILSRDDATYSRSLVADFSPFYEAGACITWNPVPGLLLKGLVINGWQNITETNRSKSVGTELQYIPNERLTLNWSTYIGNEAPDSMASRIRSFNDFYAVLGLPNQWTISLVADIGFQNDPPRNTYDEWDGMSLIVKRVLNAQWSAAARAEYFRDRYGVIVPTGTRDNFQTFSTSVNLDYAYSSSVLWRVEGRIYRSKDAIYLTSTGKGTADGFVVLSAALSF